MARLLIIILLGIAGSCARNGSYVYLYDCSGAITKFSLDTKQRLASWQPTDMAGLAGLVPLPIRDGCVLNNVRYDQLRGRFVAVAPLEATTTADDTQGYTLLAIEPPTMGVAAHTTLPSSATIPTLTVSNEREIVVTYEVPRQNEPNETWIARYDAATLEPIEAPARGVPPEIASPERALPPDIPLPDASTYPVFADR